ncbi:hypothetical protein [Leptothermofonsia sp. ETS-13]
MLYQSSVQVGEVSNILDALSASRLMEGMTRSRESDVCVPC